MASRVFQPADITFSMLSEAYLAELRAGTAGPIESYAKAFPHLAREIQAHFPTMGALEAAVGASDEASSSTLLSPGDELGGCRIECEIGRGAMGIVYKTYQADLSRHVAIKVIPLVGVSAGTVDRFELERRALARLDHPSIVPVYAYGHNARFAYLIMRYIDGVSLDKLLAENNSYKMKSALVSLQADWRHFAISAANIASGLQHAHDNGLVHRDVKPANIIMDERRKLWITDFGLVKVFDNARSISRTGDAVGTPRYMAPEQLRGVCDCRSDVYSLGITLYELAAGRRAWSGNAAELLSMKAASIELPPLASVNSDVPAGLATIIMKACEFSPDQRYQSAKELACVLERFAAGAARAERRSRKRDSDAVYQKKRKRLTAAAITLALAAFAGGLGYYELRDGEAVAAPATVVAHKARTPVTEPVIAEPVAESAAAPIEEQAIEQDESPPPGTPRATARFFDRIADPKGGDVDKVFSDYVKESIEDLGPQLPISSAQRTQALNEVDEAAREFNRQKLGERSMNELIDGYRKSTLPHAAAIANLAPIFDRSGLAPSEKRAAFENLQVYAQLVMQKRIRADVCNAMLLRLTHGRRVALKEVSALTATDQELREWLQLARTQIAAAPQSATASQRGLSADVVRVLGETLQETDATR